MSQLSSLDTLSAVTKEGPSDLSPMEVFAFSRQAMSNLSLFDQVLFERFGQGPIVPVPYTCIHHAFEAHATANPQAIAAQHLGESITYQDLDRQANRLAALLARHGVSTGDNVALFLQRSIPMVVGILASLKAGASYVPQHVGVAPERQLRHIIDVASTKVILTLSKFQHLIPVPDGHVCIAIDEVMQEPFDDDSEHVVAFRPETAIGRDNTCYIVFTSGTTGSPNGVQVTHGNACNILLTEPGNLGIRPGVKVAQMLSIAFDMAAWEILGCLGNGGTLVIRGRDFAKVAQSVDTLISTPTILSTIDAEKCRNVKVVAVAGEPCPQPLADKWAEFCTFYNSCGPTEVTIVNTVQHYCPCCAMPTVSPQLCPEILTIGKPTPNNTVYVLDEERNPCPIGEVGEMWAGGEHLGRTDDQVKIRGFRVELDSVSAVLESVPSCTQAVTLKLDSRNLVAFVSPQTVDVDLAKETVASTLPYYCTPALVVAMDEFPMTSRGKVDKKELLGIAVAQPELVEGFA
jgi:non-ribosomal peptide synthetase component F